MSKLTERLARSSSSSSVGSRARRRELRNTSMLADDARASRLLTVIVVVAGCSLVGFLGREVVAPLFHSALAAITKF